MESWEYASIIAASGGVAGLIQTLNNAGAKGWEAVSLTDSDPVLGTNQLIVIVKRRIVAFDPPLGFDAGWKTDPSDRHEKRYWDGECWTFLVSNDGDESRDPPTRLTPALRTQ